MVVGLATSVLTMAGWGIYELRHGCPLHLDLWGTGPPPDCDSGSDAALPIFASVAGVAFALGIAGMAWLIAGKRRARRLASLRSGLRF
jgi:hypothetical protein